MIDKESKIAGIIVAAIKAGYKITFERNDIGAVKPNGTQIHLAYIDELLPELKDINLSDYINDSLKEVKGHAWAGFDAGWTDCTCGKTVADLQKHILSEEGWQK